MLIDLIKGVGVTATNFPDGMSHIRLVNHPVVPDWTADIRMSISSPTDLWFLMSVANAVERASGQLGRLDITYLMGARYDRVMNLGDAVDVEVVADVINRLEFRRVRIFDPHSDVSVALIRRSEAIHNEALVKSFKFHGELIALIIPDAGAAKKAKLYQSWLNNTRIIQCYKARDTMSGRLTVHVPNGVLTPGEHGLIIDDICDGGATFNQIACQITKGDASKLHLMVSHGIFSRGTDELLTWFDTVTTTDSIVCGPRDGVTVVPCPI